LTNLGQVLQNLGRFDEAEIAMRRAVRIDLRYRRPGYQPLPLALNESLFHGPRLTEEMNRSRDGARWVVLPETRIKQKRYAQYHPTLARDLNNLACLRMAQGQKKKAWRLLDAALAIYWFSFGAFHPSTEDVWNNMSKLHQMIITTPGEPVDYYDWVKAMLISEMDEFLLASRSEGKRAEERT
jgi:hypothetical protein